MAVLTSCAHCSGQWDGSAAVSVIESGAGWWNVVVETSEANADLYLAGPPRDVVRNGQLGSFANGDDEREFVLNNQVTISSPPIYFLTPVNGYHTSNALIGLISPFCDCHQVSLMFQERRRRWMGWCCSGLRRLCRTA